jgi:hypothetical protein
METISRQYTDVLGEMTEGFLELNGIKSSDNEFFIRELRQSFTSIEENMMNGFQMMTENFMNINSKFRSILEFNKGEKNCTMNHEPYV